MAAARDSSWEPTPARASSRWARTSMPCDSSQALADISESSPAARSGASLTSTSVTRCAERNTNPKLARPLSGNVRDDAVNPDGRKHELNHGKRTDKNQRIPPRRDRLRDELRHVLNILDRLVELDRMNSVSDAIGQCHHVSVGPQKKTHRRHVVVGLVLQIRQVNRRRGRRIQRVVPNISDDTNNFAEPGCGIGPSSRSGVVNSDSFAGRILPRPKLTRSFPIDDGDRRRVLVVVFGKGSPRD